MKHRIFFPRPQSAIVAAVLTIGLVACDQPAENADQRVLTLEAERDQLVQQLEKAKAIESSIEALRNEVANFLAAQNERAEGAKESSNSDKPLAPISEEARAAANKLATQLGGLGSIASAQPLFDCVEIPMLIVHSSGQTSLVGVPFRLNGNLWESAIAAEKLSALVKPSSLHIAQDERSAAPFTDATGGNQMRVGSSDTGSSTAPSNVEQPSAKAPSPTEFRPITKGDLPPGVNPIQGMGADTGFGVVGEKNGKKVFGFRPPETK
ncbi:MAG: hypothetical protein JNJ83_20785 [Verrucomicrobiaceae bacterium]|nr:hypothetical protein [Verrucomicrobiaceae bacterium]